MSETKMMTLTCEAGHTWERESKRGRPPRWCPEHEPAKPTVIKVERPVKEKDNPAEASSPKMRYLMCEGDPDKGVEPHMYLAESKRGRKPRFCEDHMPVVDPVERQENYQKKRAERTSQEEIDKIVNRLPSLENSINSISRLDDLAFTEYTKSKNDEKFHSWMKINTRLLGHIESLRASERKLESLCL